MGGQESTSGEVSAMANPRPVKMVMAQRRPLNLVSQKPLEYEEEFSARFGRFQQPAECESGTRRCFDQHLETDARCGDT